MINTSQLSCIVELLAFLLANTVFLLAEISLPYLNKILAVCSRSWTLLDFFFLETVEQVQCDMRCDMNAMSDRERVGTTNWVKEGGRLFVIRSLNDGLDINGVAGTVQLGAHGSKGHTDDLHHERMVAFFSVGPLLSLLWSHGEFLSFRCNRWTSLYGGTRSSVGHSREKDAPKLL